MSSKKKLAFVVDHCVAAEISEYLSSLKKIKLFSFPDVGLTERSIDSHVIRKSTEAEVLLITSDKRFTEHHIPFCTHTGIIKLKVKPAARLRVLKKFLCKKEKHQTWKGVTYLHNDLAEMHQHDGNIRYVPY